MVSLQAFGRLHFGLLCPEGDPFGRSFGGVGLMVAQPDLRLHVEPAASWSAEGPLAERALAFARRFQENSCREEQLAVLSPRRLRIERALPAHAGLGSGTQLALAVARALARSWDLRCPTATLARRVGRGLRSALGIHGFEQGGFLVESGKRSAEAFGALVVRHPFPEPWRLLFVLPTGATAGLHGLREAEAFAHLTSGTSARARTEALCRLVLLGMLPALLERDVEAFGEALYEFNVRVGEAFAPVQGGVYASPIVAEIAAFLRDQNLRGVAQSSWGPLVCAVVAEEEQAEQAAERLRQRFRLDASQVWVSAACNHGAIVSVGNEEAEE